MSDKWVRASEIGEYLYCERAWWLRHVVEIDVALTPAQAAGTDYHASHGARVAAGARTRRVAHVLILAAMTLFVVGVLLYLGGS